MLRYIHLSQRFSKQLSLLEKSDKKAILAVAQAEFIVEQYKRSAEESDEIRIKRTKHGESRLKNCLKYDLGGGYRLIAVREGSHLFFVCVGSHDDIDLWLQKNRGYSIGQESQKEFCTTIELGAGENEKACAEEMARTVDSDTSYEEDLLTRVDDKTLRELFSSFYSS